MSSGQHHEQLERCFNYVLGSCGLGTLLLDITNIAQAVAAIGGAALILFQLVREVKKILSK